MTDTDQLARPGLTTGQVGLIHIHFDDADRAARFFGGLLDWEASPYRAETFTRHYVTNTELLTVLTSDTDTPTVRLWFAVTDLEAAVEAVDGFGGRVQTADLSQEGGFALVDDGQGTPLGLWRPRSDHPTGEARRTPLGEVGYVTLHVPEAAPAMAFYEAMLGWRFQDPRGNDYHHVDNTRLHLGLYGGHDTPHVTWYIRVGDVAALVPRVAELGGEPGEITESRSGLTAVCRDDQGTTVLLWQPAPGY